MYRILYQFRAHWQAAAPTGTVRFPLHGAQSLLLQAISLYRVVSADVESGLISEILAMLFKKCGTFSEC